MPTFSRQQRLAELDAHNAKLLARIALETDTAVERQTFGTPPGDERKLRGIPAIGRGVQGAPPHWRPGHRITRAA